MDTYLDTRIGVSFTLRKLSKHSVIICSVPSLSRLRISTGISIEPALWDAVRQRCKTRLPLAAKINSTLSELENRISGALLEGQLAGETKAQLRDRVVSAVGKSPKSDDGGLLLPFFRDWVLHGTAAKTRYDRQNLYSYNVWKSIVPENITFSQVDYTLYSSALQKLRERGLRENTIGQHIKTLKAVMNEAYKRGLHQNTAFLRFQKPHEATDTVYLTAEELQAVKDLELSGHLEKARDLFLLGCYTAMRFSDYSRIKKDWIKNGNIVFIEEKTGNRNSIPLSASAKAIIDKYGGAPKLSQQKLNEYIKQVCLQAAIADRVEVTFTKGGREYKEVRQKWELVSTHTSRRTGATLLIKAGAPVAWVMRVTGHKSEKTFMRYIRLSAEEYADLIRGYMDRI